jgi:hypothetical protein
MWFDLHFILVAFGYVLTGVIPPTRSVVASRHLILFES